MDCLGECNEAHRLEAELGRKRREGLHALMLAS
jgi:hypothetical protein